MIDLTWREEPHHTESLAISVRAILAHHQAEIAYEELCALLGFGGALVATAGQSPAHWSSALRDRFLVRAARALGLRLRDMHPPAAAHNLARSGEFAAHFRDSYVPLIRAALEHGQLVLAWRGWPPPRERLWGVITDVRNDMVVGYSCLHGGYPLPLVGPPHQVYVAETADPGAAAELWQRVRLAARHTLAWGRDAAPGDEHVTGSAALRAWEQTWRTATAGGAEQTPLADFARLARTLAAARSSVAHWLQSAAPSLPALPAELTRSWADALSADAAMLTPLQDAAFLTRAIANPDAVAQALRDFASAEDVALLAAAAIEPVSDTAGSYA